ncbi:MAG: hypothetical protein AB7E47_09145 [Desulfovibrionaceae bacterium]
MPMFKKSRDGAPPSSALPEDGVEDMIRPEKDAAFNESVAVDRMRTRCMLGAWALGLAAGLIKGTQAPGDGPLWIEAAMGLAFSFLGAVGGGFVGSLAYLVVQGLLKRRDEGGGDLADGVILGSFVGSFLGLVGAVLFASPQNVVVGTGIGSAIGACVGAFQPGTARVILRMLVHDARPETAHVPESPPGPDSKPDQR